LSKSISREYVIAADHPCLDGHFPGDPIVPGVVLLDTMRMLLQQWRPQLYITAIPQAKFHHPLRPEEPFIIALTERSPNRYRFECLRRADNLASGVICTEERPS